jgi:gamma-tubulin complex component 3
LNFVLVKKIIFLILGSASGILIDQIDSFSRHGDKLIHGLASRCLESVCKPYLEILCKWISNGVLEDPYNEFFISISKDMEDVWNDKFVINPQIIPSYINEQLSKKILVIGKSLDFMRNSCKKYIPFKQICMKIFLIKLVTSKIFAV